MFNGAAAVAAASSVNADLSDAEEWLDRVRATTHGHIIEHLDEFNSHISSLLDRPHLSDLKLVIEGQTVPVNRSILAARSEYFHALLYNGMKESELDTVELPSAKLKPFKMLLKFIYSGKLLLQNLTADELTDLLVTARIFCFNRMVCDISTYLRVHITNDNVWSLYKVAKLFDIDRLSVACERFFDKNAESILKHEDFVCLDTEEVCEMIKRDSFYAPEPVILRAVCNYYKQRCGNSPDENAALIDALLASVRLSLVKSSEIKAIFSEYQIPVLSESTQSNVNKNCIKKRLSFWLSPTKINARKKVRSSMLLPSELESIKQHQHQQTQQHHQQQQQQTSTALPSASTISHPDAPLSCQKDSKAITESIRGYLVYNRNVATREFGVEPVKGRLKKDLVCGSDRNYTIRTCTNHSLPHPDQTREECIQIAFGRPFIVNNIRMLLLDDGQRSFSYIVEVSTDSRNWVKVADYSQYWCRSWQHIFFPERVVRHVRISGLRSKFYGNVRNQMLLVYFECMYNSIDSKLFKLTEDNQFIEPKSSVVDASNTIAFSSSSPVGTMRHFRLRSKTTPATLSQQHSQPVHQVETTNCNSANSNNNNSSNNNNISNSNIESFNLTSLMYRTTDFARGSVNWISPGKVTFQLAQPFKISSFAFKIIPIGNETNYYTYSISITNDLEVGPWKTVTQVSRMCNDLFVVKFEPQIVTFIEIRTVDHPNLSHFSIRHFECPFSCP